MAISIAWGTKIIYVPKADLTLIQASPEVREINLNWFRLELKKLEDDPEGMPFSNTHNHVTETTLAGLTYARIIEIINGYTVEFEDGQYTVNCVGANHNLSDVKVANQVSLIVNNAAGLITNTAIEFSSYQERVTIDTVNGVSGTLYPTGTTQQPVNNLADALSIASYRGLTRLYFMSDFTFQSGDDISDFNIIGDGAQATNFTFLSGSIADSVMVERASITGVITTGTTWFNECLINTLTVYNAQFSWCIFADTLTATGNLHLHILESSDGALGIDGKPIIDLNNSGRGLMVIGWSGELVIRNLTNDEIIDIGLHTGYVKLEDTITAGLITIRGIGTLIDNSTATSIDTNAMVNQDLFATISSFDGFVTIDTDFGTAGTDLPIGTDSMPVNNITDARIIADREGIRGYRLRGAITLTQSYISWTFESIGSVINDIITFGGQDISQSKFVRLTVTGTMAGSQAQFEGCTILDVAGMNGHGSDCNIAASGAGAAITLGGSGSVFYGRGIVGKNIPTIIDMGSGDGRNVLSHFMGSNIQINNLTGNSGVVLGMADHGTIILDTTCTGGTANIGGFGKSVDNSTGTIVTDNIITVDNDTIAQAVWDEDLSAHTTAGTTGRVLSLFGFEHGVHLDAVNGSAGTAYPLGTHGSPVNNWADAKTIAENFDVHAIHIMSNITITGENLNDYAFDAFGHVDVQLTIGAGCTTHNTYFEEIILTGEFDGTTYIERAKILELTNFSGYMFQCIFYDNITLALNSAAIFLTCYGVKDFDQPITVDFNGGSGLFNDYHGIVQIEGMNNPAAQGVQVGLQNGYVLIGSTCTESTMLVDGLGIIYEDNSSGNFTLLTTGLLNNETIADATWDEDITTGHSIAKSAAVSLYNALGLMQENYYMDQCVYTTYGGQKLLNSARIRTYTVANSVGTDNDILATYTLTSVWNDNELQTYKMIKV